MAKATITTVAPTRVSRIEPKGINRAKFIDVPGRVVINQVLPFRVKFTTIGIDAYGANNPAPIGIAVIGYNNYVI